VVAPTRRCAVVVFVCGVATIVTGAGAVFVASLLLVLIGAFAVDAMLLRRSRSSGVRTLSPTVPLMGTSPYSVEVSTEGPADVRRLRQPSPAEIRLVLDESAGPELEGEMSGRHRGNYPVGAAVARVCGPLGLTSRDVVVDLSGSVRVIPDLPRARRLAAARRRGGGVNDGRVRNRLGVGTDFEAIRDYSPDDDIRQVNWVASARTGRPMSNQYRIDENRDVVCLIDTGRLMASPVGGIDRLDVALDAMTILCVEAEESQDRVGAIAFSHEVHRQLSPRRYGTAAIVDALYDLETSEVESDYERAFIAVGRHKRALVVLFSDLVDESASRALLAACPILIRRHALMVVSCRDPDLASAIGTAPTDTHDVLRTSIAIDLLRTKDRVRYQLESMGVVVVEADAVNLGSACVRSYLALKARARL
jgi:uncharacterized protein (DUF58 family)